MRVDPPPPGEGKQEVRRLAHGQNNKIALSRTLTPIPRQGSI
jgi:hypothetical protein